MVTFGMLLKDDNEHDRSYKIVFSQGVIEETRILEPGKEWEWRGRDSCEHKGSYGKAE